MLKSELWSQIQEMGKNFQEKPRVNAKSRKADLLAEFDRMTDISEGINDRKARNANEFKDEQDHKEDPAEKRAVKELVKIIRDWRKTGMNVPLSIDRNIFKNITIVRAFRRSLSDIQVLAKMSLSTYTINQLFLDHLMDIIAGDVDIEDSDNTSDAEFLMYYPDDDDDDRRYIVLEKLPEVDGAKLRPGGKFFKYLSKSNYDLRRQQIFNKIEPELLVNNCLMYALQMGGLPNKSLDDIKLKIKTRNVPARDIKIIADTLNICITVRGVYSKRNQIYGNEWSEHKFNLGLVDNHYFLIEPTNITKYAFSNNLTEDRWNEIDSTGRTSNMYIDTYKCVQLLMKPGLYLLNDISLSSELYSTTYSAGITEFTDLSYNNKDVRTISSKAIRQLTEDGRDVVPDFIEDMVKSKQFIYDSSNVVFFDFETNISEKHKAFLCHYVNKDDPNKHHGFEGYTCGEVMLRSLCSIFGSDSKLKGKPAVVHMYAHNAGYDYRFLVQYIKVEKILRQGSGLLYCSGKFTHRDKIIEIIIKDTYKIISKPLRDFGAMFKLDTEKEVMPYSLQTNKHIDAGGIIPMSEVMDCFEMKDPEFSKAFLENCKKWDCIYENEFELFTYASRYCRIDCEVLHKGYEIFNGWMIETTGESVFNHLTIPSLVHEFFINKGCYTDVYELSGICRAYIQKCVVGGRCALANNKKAIQDVPIADYDAVSLYPSAMSRMSGFLKGCPKVLVNKTMKFLNNVSGYFIRIEIIHIGIKRAFPLMSEMRGGVRCFVNDCMTMYVDKVGLEDMINFQDIEFNIIDGYYFNEGHNDTICDVIKHLFQARIQKKREGNPAQEILKLVMNSSYGKSLLKPIIHKDKVFNTEHTLNKYVVKNFETIESYTRIHQTSEKFVLKEIIPVITHFNIPQVGVEILSMSKRIMNEVMCLAENNDIDIYYQDTDSLHLRQDKLEDLMSLYYNVYNRVLNGNGMGEFNSDFSMSGCSGVHSKKFIGLGKKTYLDVLNGTLKDGTIKTDYHIRMKGVPNSCVRWTADRLYGGDLVALYTAMYEGEPIAFDLLEGGARCSFETFRDLSINNRATFTRTLKF
jgi:hypothetical protein